MEALPPMKIRCPADDVTDPGAHLALDVRLPLTIGRTLTALSRLRCPCGKGLVVDTRPETRGVGGVA
jgi:hypothetical protein